MCYFRTMNLQSFKYWILAARPKTLPASVVPVIIASCLAFHFDKFKWIPAIICFLFALLAQIVSNFLNDYFDYMKGSDRTDRLGPERAVAQGWIKPQTMLKASVRLFAFACLLGLGVIHYAGWQMIWVGLLVCVGAFAYSSGPYPLAYNGWGDVCVVAFYGLIPVGFTYYIQALEWPVTATLCGLSVGLITTNILVSNNFRDREQDKISGKNTTIVLFGEKFGLWFYLFNGIAGVIICLFFLKYDLFWAAILPMLYLIPHIITWRKMYKIFKGRELNVILAKSSFNTIIFGVLLSLGIILS